VIAALSFAQGANTPAARHDRPAAHGQFDRTLRRATDPPLLLVPRPDGEGQLELRREDLSEETSRQLDRLNRAAAQVEGIFFRKLLQELDKMAPIGGQGPMRDLAVDAFQMAMADTATRGAGLGIARSIVRQASQPILLAEAARLLLPAEDAHASPNGATEDSNPAGDGAERPRIENMRA
jgi:Rod binding domain-containing protein